jgi:hypothetical protein
MEAKILVMCKHEGILATILRLIGNNPDWQAMGTDNIADAKQALNAEKFNLVLLGNGFTADEEAEIETYVKQHHTKTKIVYHYGGGSGLLSAEIYQALA